MELVTLEGLNNRLGCTTCGRGVGDLSNDEASAIIKEHFMNLPIETQTKIITETALGKFDTMSKETAVAVEKICKAGIVAKGQTFFENNWQYLLGGAIALGGVYYIAKKSNRPKRTGKK